MVPPVARLGTRWASRSTAPARGKQPGLSQGGPRRSQNRSPPAVTPLCWGGRALRAQCGFALAPPEAGKGPRRAFANSPERYSPGGDPFAMCLRLRPGRSRGARRVWRRGARLPRGGTAQTRQRITCKYRSASRLGASIRSRCTRATSRTPSCTPRARRHAWYPGRCRPRAGSSPRSYPTSVASGSRAGA